MTGLHITPMNLFANWEPFGSGVTLPIDLCECIINYQISDCFLLDVLEEAVVATTGANPAAVLTENGLAVDDDKLAPGSWNNMVRVIVIGRYLVEGCGKRTGLDIEC